ncbi:MAG TPA: glycosyltransferase, partial [Aquihabitans sp.]|nr:glycosyltransferase [Aquihabitans sp.]
MSAHLVFVGFHGSADRATPESQNEIIASTLRDAGYEVRAGSAEPRQVLRLLDQLRLVVANLGWADAVVACQFSGRRAWTTFLVTRITRRAAIPTVLVLRGGSLPQAAAAHPHRIDSTLRLTTRVLAPSSYLERAFRDRGHQVSIIPNLVRAPITVADHPPVDLDAPNILWMRAFHAVYQPELAVAAFAALRERHPQATLTMAGPDRGLLDATRRRAAELGVDAHIRYPGYLEGEHKAEALREHDLFLNTPSIDNTPVSVIEAMG